MRSFIWKVYYILLFGSSFTIIFIEFKYSIKSVSKSMGKGYTVWQY